LSNVRIQRSCGQLQSGDSKKLNQLYQDTEFAVNYDAAISNLHTLTDSVRASDVNGERVPSGVVTG
jgi:hypothetical protein